MYELIKSFTKKDRQWEETYIGDMNLKEALSSYDEVLLTTLQNKDLSIDKINTTNFPRFINATQRESQFGGNPERSIDGNFDGIYNDDNLSFTGMEEGQWWQGELSEITNLKQIIIHNRSDGIREERLNNFHIIITDVAIGTVGFDINLTHSLSIANAYHHYQSSVENGVYIWNIPENVSGRYITIYKERGLILSGIFDHALVLAEVTAVTQSNNVPDINISVNTGNGKVDDLSSYHEISEHIQAEFFLNVAPSNGKLTLERNGEFTYNANDNFVGVDSFKYAALIGGVGVIRTVILNVNFNAFSMLLSENQKLIGDFSGDVNTWLSTLGDSINKTQTRFNFSTVSAVKFHDAWKYPVTVEAANIAYGEGQLIPEGSRYDIRITNDLASNVKGSVTNMEANMLLCVDGRIVSTEIRDNWWYGINGNRHLSLTQSNLISLIDFNDVGGITRVPLDETNVTLLTQTPYDLSRNQTRVVIDFGSTELHTVSPLMVLDGFLHVFDGTYSQASSNHLLLTIDHKRAVQRIVSRARDASASISFANVRDGGVNTTSFDVLEYLKETDSFAVLVNTRDLNIMKETLGRTGIFGQYTHYRAIQGLVFYEDKELVPYTIVDWNEHDVAVSVKDNRDFSYLSDTNDWENLGAINGVYEPERKIRLREAHCIDLYTFI